MVQEEIGKWIIGSVATVFDIILLYIGCWLLYWGAIWLFSTTRLEIFHTRIGIFYASLMVPLGVAAIVSVIVVAWKVKSFLWPLTKMRKRIIAVAATMLDIILLYIGCWLLYWGAILNLFGTRITIGLGLLMMFTGVPIIVGGIIVAWKIKAFLWPPKKAPKKSPPLKDNAGDTSAGINSSSNLL